VYVCLAWSTTVQSFKNAAIVFAILTARWKSDGIANEA
jgi:hypothetical protein